MIDTEDYGIEYLSRIQPERWVPQKRAVFRSLGWAAVAVLRTDHIANVTLIQPNGHEAARYGGNRGVWPVRLAVTGSWEDTLSNNYDNSPFDRVSVIGRVWTGSESAAKRLHANAVQWLETMSREVQGSDLENGYFDIGAAVDWVNFLDHLATLGQRLGIPTWDDDDTARDVDRRYKAMQSGIKPSASKGKAMSSR